MPELLQHLLRNFTIELTTGLPRFLGQWAAGLASYFVIASLVTYLAARRGKPRPERFLAHLFPGHLYLDETARITMRHFVIYGIFWAPLFAMLTFTPPLAASAIARLLTEQFGPRTAVLHADWLVALVQTTVIVLSMSFASFVQHLAAHRVPLFWSFHRSHHSLEALTLPATARQHPLDLFSNQLLMNVFAAIFGGAVLFATGTALHPATFLIVGLGAGVYFLCFGIFNHSHIPVSLGWMNRIIMAPVLHQFHHSAEARHRDRNIGSFWGLMFWDWIFGTLYLPSRDEQYRWGLNEEELGKANPHQCLRDFYLEPFQYAWALIRSSGLGCLRPSP